ncbi:MAG: acyl carrier protein [Firmicutes bacterium]|jgi:phosphopantetheine attachment domain protein|nr:acyl carrier protein [Clostridia bacterium]MBS5022467.1 acyl carrier protein [Bacillota bacterium]
MNREEIEKKIVDLARETTGAQLTETVTLKENGLDSLSLVLLIASIEEAYSFSFDEDDLQPDKLLTLKDLTLLTEKYL